jgi:hypothetical protein
MSDVKHLIKVCLPFLLYRYTRLHDCNRLCYKAEVDLKHRSGQVRSFSLQNVTLSVPSVNSMSLVCRFSVLRV